MLCEFSAKVEINGQAWCVMIVFQSTQPQGPKIPTFCTAGNVTQAIKQKVNTKSVWTITVFSNQFIDRLRHGRQSEAPLVLPISHPCSDEHWGFRWLWAGQICNLGTPYPTPSSIPRRRLRVTEYNQGGIARHVVARPSLCHRICRGRNDTRRTSELFSSKRCYDVASTAPMPILPEK